MHGEDAGHAEEPDRDQEAWVMTGSQRGTGHEDRDEQRDDRDIRRDHEVLDRYEGELIALRIREQQP